MFEKKKTDFFFKTKKILNELNLSFEKKWNLKKQSKLWQQFSSFPLAHRLLKACLLGLGVSLGLFYLMSSLISGEQELNRFGESESFIEFIRLKKEDFVQERKRQLPKKPKKQQKPPPPKKMATAADAPKKPEMKINPSLNIKGALKGGGPALGGAGISGGSEVTPIVRLEPQYPRKAAMQGIEGWVKLSFDITTVGTVENVKILDSNPKRIFDMAAKRALYKWKYRPKTNSDGQPMPQTGQTVKLDFSLEE